MIKWPRDDRIQPFRLRPLKAQGFGGHLAYRVGTARSQRLQLVHGQPRFIDRAVAVPAADVEKAAMEVRCTKRTQKIQRSVEIDVEIAVSVLERLGNARPRSEMNDRVRANRRNLPAERRVAHVLMFGQRSDGPAIPMFRGHMSCKGLTHEAGMARDQQLGHGAGRGMLRGIKKSRARPFMPLGL